MIAHFNIPGLPFEPKYVLGKRSHESDSLTGWIGLATWTVKDEDGSLWDMDWRYAFGEEIFKQNWIDFGWNKQKLLYSPTNKELPRKKVITYFCAPEINLSDNDSGHLKLEPF